MPDLSLINAALTRIGEDPITSLEDGSSGAVIAAENYESIVRTELSYRWRWASRLTTLNRIAGTPDGGEWTDAYQLPPDALALRTTKVAGVNIDYELQSDRLLATQGSEASLAVKEVWRVPESAWPGWFREGIIRRLEAVFLRGIGERYDEAEARDKAAENAFAKMKLLDAQSAPSRDPMASSILRARNG